MSSSSESEGLPPFTALTEYLKDAVAINGVIDVPKNVLDIFSGVGSPLDDSAIRACAKLFEGCNQANRLRLTPTAFINIIAILFHLRYSTSQLKLLFAFMSTVELLKNETQACEQISRARKQATKAEEIQTLRQRISAKLIPKILRIVGEDYWNFRIRIVAAQLLLCLIRDDPEAHSVMQNRQDLCPVLGRALVDAKDYILQIAAANVIREMCDVHCDLSKFWPSHMVSADYEAFPLSKTDDSQWIGALLNFLSSRNVGKDFDENGAAFRLLSLRAGRYAFSDRHANIVALIGDRLTFVIPAQKPNNLLLMDLPLKSKVECRLDEATSQDVWPDTKEKSLVHLRYTEREGSLILRGQKSALDSVHLLLRNSKDADAFIDAVSHAIADLPAHSDGNETSSMIGASADPTSFTTRIDVGMVDMTINSDQGSEETASEGDSGSVFDDETPSRSQPIHLSFFRYAHSPKLHDAASQAAQTGTDHIQGSLLLGSPYDGMIKNGKNDLELPLIKDLSKPTEEPEKRAKEASIGERRDSGIHNDFPDFMKETPDRSQPGYLTTEEESSIPPPGQLYLPYSPTNASQFQRTAGAERNVVMPAALQNMAPKVKHTLMHQSSKNRTSSMTAIAPPLTLATHAAAATSEIQAQTTTPKSQTLSTAFYLEAQVYPAQPVTSAIWPTTNKEFTKGVTEPECQPILERAIELRPSETEEPIFEWKRGEVFIGEESQPVAKKLKLGGIAATTAKRKNRQSQATQADQVDAIPPRVESKRPKSGSKTMRMSEPAKKVSSTDDTNWDLELEKEQHPAIRTKPKTGRLPKATKQKLDQVNANVSKKQIGESKRESRKIANPVKGKCLALARSKRALSKSATYVKHSASELDDIDETEEADASDDQKLQFGQHNKITGPKAPVPPRRNREADERQTAGKLFEIKDAISPPTKTQVFASSFPDPISKNAKRRISSVRQGFCETANSENDSKSPEPSAEMGHQAELEEIAQSSAPQDLDKNSDHIHRPTFSFGSALAKYLDTNLAQPREDTRTQNLAASATPFSNAKSFIASVNAARSVSPKRKQLDRATTAKAKNTKVTQKCSPPAQVMTARTNVQNTTNPPQTLPKSAPDSQVDPEEVTLQLRITDEIEAIKQYPGKPLQETRDLTHSCNMIPQISGSRLADIIPDQSALSNLKNTTDRQLKFWGNASGMQEADPEENQEETNQDENKEKAHVTVVPDQVPQDDTAVQEEVAMANIGICLVQSPSSATGNSTRGTNVAYTFPVRGIRAEKARTQPNADAIKKIVTPKTSTVKFKLSRQWDRTTKVAPPEEKDTQSMGNEEMQKKISLGHLAANGPENQGMISPLKHKRNSIGGILAPQDDWKNHQPEKQYSNAPATLPAAEVNRIDNSPSVLPAGSFRDDEGMLLLQVEGAAIDVSRVLTESEDSANNGSQASRVDPPGNSYLQHQYRSLLPLVPPQDTMDISDAADEDQVSKPDVESKLDEAEKFTSPESESSASDPDVRSQSTQECLTPEQSGSRRRKINRTLSKFSPPKAIKNVSKKEIEAATMQKKPFYEQNGPGVMTREHFPMASRKINTAAFKKQALKVLLTGTLDPVHHGKESRKQIPAQPVQQSMASSGQPLITKQPAIPDTIAPSLGDELPSVARNRVCRSENRTPIVALPENLARLPPPASFATGLRSKTAPKELEKDDGVRENIRRSKENYHHKPEDADVIPLNIEYSCAELQTHQKGNLLRQNPIESSDESTPSPPQGFCQRTARKPQDLQMWRKEIQGTQKPLHDILMEITDTVLLRLENEERAIKRKSSRFLAGGAKVVNHFDTINANNLQYEGAELRKGARALEQEMKTLAKALENNVRRLRGSLCPEMVLGIIKGREGQLLEKIKNLIQTEHGEGEEAEDEAEGG